MSRFHSLAKKQVDRRLEECAWRGFSCPEICAEAKDAQDLGAKGVPGICE